jgi:glycosyltransferase involved in cell wall biosynthesis
MKGFKRKVKISTCIIAQDCESTLGLCLQSVRPFSNEIIVVDGGSKDNSLEIARQHADKVVVRPWPNDFADQRNYAIGLSQYEWVFLIDSDEFVGTHFGSKIQKFIQNHPYIGYLFQRHWLVPGESSQRPYYLQGQLFEQTVTRLVHRSVFDDKSFSEAVHEDLIHEFGYDVGGQKFAVTRDLAIYHLCLYIPRHVREKKVAYYEALRKDAGAAAMYLYEDYGYASIPLETQMIPEYAKAYLAKQSLHFE